MSLISKCCQAPRHHLHPDCCSDCGEHAEFVEEETLAEGPEGEEAEKMFHEIEQDRLDRYFRARLAPAILAIQDKIYNSSKAEHGAMESGKLKDLRVQMARTLALREALDALQTLTGIGLEETLKDLERPY